MQIILTKLSKISFNFALIFFCILSGLTVNSQDIKIYSSDVAPDIDGVVDGLWNDYPGQSLDVILSGAIDSDQDFSAEFKVTWDNSAIYFLVDITDDIQIYDSDETAYQDDAMEIYLDVNNDKLTSFGETDFQYTFRHNDPTIRTSYNSAGIVFAEGSKTGGYILEVKIPWSTVGQLNPQSDQLLGIDVHVHDDDDGGDRDAKRAWYATVDESWQNPGLFATGILVGTFTETYRAEKPFISHEHGFYTEPFDVTISSPIPGAQVVYTLDGTDPVNSATAVTTNAPTKVRIDPTNTENRGRTPGVVLRASTIKAGYDYSRVVTRTYIFLDDVKNQAENPGHDWPTYDVNGQEIDLGISTVVANDARYKDLIDEALTEIPTFSIVTDNANLWDPATGIYVNAMEHGIDWERPASVELINPDGSKGFQIDAGLRIRGGWSRNNDFPKHAFRLFFRGRYGNGKLDYPLFDGDAVSSFDKFDLRCSQNYAWSRHGSDAWDPAELNTLNRDVFSRDLQLSLGQPSTRSKYYHLYVNGLYWGLFQTQERSEARFASSYFGGDADNYDVIKRAGGEDGIEATDGTLETWQQVWNYVDEGFAGNDNYYKIQGLKSDGTRDTLLPVLVDIDNLIDYMLIIFYTGNFDAPVSKFGDNKGPNNFYAIKNKKDKESGFRFFAHDSEHTLITRATATAIGLYENRVNIGSLTDNFQMTNPGFTGFNPQWLHFKLSDDEDYVTRFADRAYKYLYNNGAMTPGVLSDLFIKRTYEYDTAVIGESLRWGDIGANPPRTKDDDWVGAVNEVMNMWFPARTDIVIDQLKDEGLLPSLDAPEFTHNSTSILEEEISVDPGYSIQILNSNSNGSIYYTMDGTDPRTTDGIISESAVLGNNQVDISILYTTIIKARIKNGDEWSAVHELSVITDEDLSGLQLTEIHYHPLNYKDLDDSEVEFLELKNSGDNEINLTKTTFVKGVEYTFNEVIKLAPGEFVVLSSNAIAFENRYGFEPDGEYEGQLNNAGERIALIEASGDTVFSVKFNDKGIWPSSPDGAGFSLVPNNDDLNADWDLAENWRASSSVGGSPGADDPYIEIAPIFITEILTNSETPETDAIELFNPNNIAVDIGGWFLTDDRLESQKWQVPFNTSIPANSYLVFFEGHYEGDLMVYTNAEFGSSFSLSAFGDEVYLFSGNSQGNLTGYEFGFDFGAFEQGVSNGKYVTSVGDVHYVAQKASSLSRENGLPKVGPVVFSQINYHPQLNDFEYLTLLNISNIKVNLFDASSNTPWKVSGLDYEFPDTFYLEPGETVYLVESSFLPSDFRSIYNLDENQKILNYKGNLSNDGERLSLRKALTPFYDDTTLVEPYILIDRVKYNDNELWPDADGNGFVLTRKNVMAYGNDPANWKATPPELTITTIALANGIQGILYNEYLEVQNGTEPYFWTIQGDMPQGLILDSISGSISGKPQESGTFNLEFEVIDQLARTDNIILNLTIEQNVAPVANDDYVSVSKNIAVNTDALFNDEDEDGDKDYWSVVILSSPQYGTAIVNSDNSIVYIPDDGYTGDDQLSYQISDLGGSSAAEIYFTVTPQEKSVEYSVTSSADDGEEFVGSGAVGISSSDLELIYDTNGASDQLVGIRFVDVDIPQGATISKAYIQFQTDEVSTNAANLVFYGENEDNTDNFSDGDIISNRNLTSAFVNWSPDPWNSEGERSLAQQTPDLSAIIQEIVNRSGWTSSNSLSIIVTGSGTRTAESFDGDPAGAATIYIEYMPEPSVSEAPIANAGIDRLIENGNIVTLNGSGSYSSDGSLLNYTWNIESKPTGSSMTITNPFVVSPSITPDVSGTLIVTLTVDNGLISSDPDTVYITVVNTAPVSFAGNDRNVKQYAKTYLNGSNSYDFNNDSLSFVWNFVTKPAGSSASFSEYSSVYPWFIPDVAGTYEISLVVNDGIVNSTSDIINIEVLANTMPVSIAGDDKIAKTGDKVYFYAGDSYDNEGDWLTYSWEIIEKPAGSATLLSSMSSINPYFIPDNTGDYMLTLTVNDGTENSVPDTVMLEVSTNLIPIADAGSDLETLLGMIVRLNGNNSFDSDGDLIEYSWRTISKPAGSTSDLSGSGSVIPSFIPDVVGTYTFGLIVNDGNSDSGEDEVTVIVNENNVPIATAGADFSAFRNVVAHLDASGSYDPEGRSLAYHWTVVSKPSQAQVYISDESAINPEFVGSVDGVYEIQLIVNDGVLNSIPDVVVINVITDVTEITANIEGIKAYPNPFNESLFVSFTNPDLQDVMIQLYNMSGVLVYQRNYKDVLYGIQKLHIDRSDMNINTGLYYVVVKPEKGNVKTLKVNYLE